MTGGGPNQEMFVRRGRVRRETQTTYRVPEDKLVAALERYVVDYATAVRILNTGFKKYRGGRKVDGEIVYRVKEDKFYHLLKIYRAVKANEFLDSLVA